MYKIKFGTDGWREIIADNYTIENVKRVAEATAKWILNSSNNHTCTVGYDCRFGGKMFAEATASVLAHNGIKVFLSDRFCSTPMISLANTKLNTFAGIIITASHNPPAYNGYKIKANYGGPVVPSEIEKVEQLIDYNSMSSTQAIDFYINNKNVEMVNIEKIYLDEVIAKFDITKLKQYEQNFGYDAMFGSGQNVIKSLLPNAMLMNCEYNPGFNGVAPEPILKNLKPFSEAIKNNPNILCGLATDGDADRIGWFDSSGRFIDSHHLILLLMQYLVEHKQLKGKIVKSFSVSSKIEKLAKHLGLETITTKIGFKYICELMITDDVLIGAEESGGIAVKGHIPERDGIWMGLLILEYMALKGKTIEELITDLYAIIGEFAVERYDLHITETQKQNIISACKNNLYTEFGPYKIEHTEDLDGYKYHLGNEEWVMIRPSGTEPVLRVYAESSNSENAIKILEHCKATILA
ncbi:MAG: phosphoglucomutase/phosphomannomutase family protein [Bacteroidota bacterium]|nr:phosphoglucomutase/phosphomannomutase family protein [Bacteroidota bacterium]